VDNTKVANGTFTFTAGKGTANETAVSVAATGLTAGTSTVEDLADKLNADANFNKTFTASVERDANGVQTGITVRANDGRAVDDTTDPDAAGLTFTDTGTAATPTSGLKFNNAANAQLSINAIDDQIKAVSTARAQLGAYQNRFEHTINNANVAIENLSASESRIRDTDMAQEMMSYTRSQILTQAGTAMLSQANQSQQGVLSLLR
jgi:flagellin